MTRIIRVNKKQIAIYLITIITLSVLSTILIHGLYSGKDFKTLVHSIQNLEDGSYENALLINCTGRYAKVNVNGLVKNLNVNGLDPNLENVLCNITVKNGRINAIDLKMEQISGKVLSVNDEYVDIEGYGRIPVENSFVMYDLENQEHVMSTADIIVGYSLQNFIVAEGKICGAVKEKSFHAVNIRVMLTTSGFKSMFHESVTITSNEGFSLNSENESIHYNGGEEVTFTNDSENVQNKRVRIIPDGTNRLIVKSINRSQGFPDYAGTLEVEHFDEGLVLINDVDIEEYVSRVVPSEMPTSYGLEALKVQAVCARSYAYKELNNTNYSQYGAHVDDSVQYQVYNNTDFNEVAYKATSDTKGELLMYGDEIVQTYYYSTSAGVTTDVSLWGSNQSAYPYYQSVTVGDVEHQGNLTNEDDFRAFITSRYDTDYDNEFPLYRWNLTVDVETLGAHISSKIGYEIGNVQEIRIDQRIAGGAASCITVIGTKDNVTIDRESDIRTDFGNGDVDIQTQSGVTRYDRLPSSFIYFDPYYDENGNIAGYTIYGGGYGHGIGMSQNAVKKMSQQMSYDMILKFFYKNTEIRST